MTGTKQQPGPAPLDPAVIKKLLDLLSTSDEFRQLFKKDAHAALVQAGWKPPEADDLVSASGCLQMNPDQPLARKEDFMRDRKRLEEVLSSPFAYSPFAFHVSGNAKS